jgi:formylglycine-generating enzyme required for sulfatase activity
MTESHQKTRARVVAGEELGLIAESLQTALRKWGFEVSDPEAEVSTRQQDTRAVEEKGANQAPNRVIYAPGARAQARQIANRVSYLYYGVAPELVEGDRSALPAETDVLVELRAIPRGFRDLFRVGPIEPEMIPVTGGKFQMGDLQGEGDPNEGPVRTMSIRPFAIGRHEVTFEEYDRFAEATEREKPDDWGWGRGRRPVINVSWDDALFYAEWLSAQTGKRYRLPSEAEWEYAARAGTTTSYWWGDEVGENRANCDGCGSQWDGRQTAPVGSFEPNPFGLYDTAGNVWEWVQDCWHDSYEGAPTDGSAWEEENCSWRVIRGGSWNFHPWNVRSAHRGRGNPVNVDNFVGFRLAQDIE